MAPTSHRSRFLFACVAALILMLVLVGCSAVGGSSNTADADASPSGTAVVTVGTVSGPCAMGLASFMDKAASGTYANEYTVTVGTDADSLTPAILSGEVDIALVPANVAAVLYNNTKGGVLAIDANVFGALSVVTGDSAVTSLESLEGKTVLVGGKATANEYVLEYLLKLAGIYDKVTIECKASNDEVTAALISDPTAIGVLPQPQATLACAQNLNLKVAIDLDSTWTRLAPSGSKLVCGVAVVRKEFLEGHEDVVREFVEAHKASVDAANADPESVAQIMVAANVVESESLATHALPYCHLVCVTGTEMQGYLDAYFVALASIDKESIGGTLVPASFYWLG